MDEPIVEITIPYEDGAIKKAVLDIMDTFGGARSSGDFDIRTSALIPPECFWWANDMSAKTYKEWGYLKSYRVYILIDVVGSKTKIKRLPPEGATVMKKMNKKGKVF